MRRGDFEAAWRVCDRVLQLRRERDCSHWPRHLQYVWDGAPLEDRRVLVRCYHGLGDTLQFMRLLAPLRARAQRVILWIQPALADIARTLAGVDQLVPLHDGTPQADYDVDIELMELPHALRLSARDLPGCIPYIFAPTNLEGAWLGEERRHGNRLRVGLAWRGGDWVFHRSIPVRLLEPLGRVTGVDWFSLQYPAEQPPFSAADIAHRDIARVAARMQSLDLIISVDTMTAHLAGALGLNVWTLLAADCDWRWMSRRADSPWYPTMRLFRQRRAGQWRDVITAVAQELQTFHRERPPHRVNRARDIR
jgi:hypothetical protein